MCLVKSQPKKWFTLFSWQTGDYSALYVSHIPTPTLTQALFEGGCLTRVPVELNDHRTKVGGRRAACFKARAERVLSGTERKDSPCRLIKQPPGFSIHTLICTPSCSPTRNTTHTHTHTHTHTYLGSASPVAWQQLMGKKAGGAPMIKISWVAVFDPQYAVIVSPQLYKKPNTGVAGEGREYINFLTLVKRWLALLTDFSSNFLRIKKPPPRLTQVNLGLSLLFRPLLSYQSLWRFTGQSHISKRG